MKALIQNNEILVNPTDELGVIVGKVYQLTQKHLWLEDLNNFSFEDIKVVESEELQEELPEGFRVVGKNYEIVNDKVVISNKIEAIPVVVKTPEQIRQEAELTTFIEAQGHPIKLTDKAIYNLQAYILSGIESVSWKCDDDAFITVSQEDMQAMLVQLMTKKNELFTQEQSLGV